MKCSLSWILRGHLVRCRDLYRVNGVIVPWNIYGYLAVLYIADFSNMQLIFKLRCFESDETLAVGRKLLYIFLWLLFKIELPFITKSWCVTDNGRQNCCASSWPIETVYVVKKLDSAAVIHWINLMRLVSLIPVLWIVIFPVDGTIHLRKTKTWTDL